MREREGGKGVEREGERGRKRERERLTHGLLWRPPTHTQGGNWGVGGGGGGERILHFSTIFDDLVDDVHRSAYIYHFTLYSHEHKIHHIRTGCWITSVRGTERGGKKCVCGGGGSMWGGGENRVCVRGGGGGGEERVCGREGGGGGERGAKERVSVERESERECLMREREGERFTMVYCVRL